MTTLDSTTSDCGCSGSPTGTGSGNPTDTVCEDLPNTPFVGLRAVTGMLLGEDDFRVLLGNPRGKLMLHQGWLHGRGVVWGLGLEREGNQLRVLPGLAVDGVGRELMLTSSWCVDLDAWVERWLDDHDVKRSCEDETVEAWVVAELGCCLDRPVTPLSHPCDVTRPHDDWSRVLETARIRIVDQPPPDPHTYHRLRVLLGLDEVGPDDEAGEEAAAVAAEVAAADSDDRAATLLRGFRRLAARDEMELGPARREGDADLPLAPILEEDAAVVLARIELTVGEDQGCLTVREAEVDPLVRSVLLPTRTIQELLCGLAPGLIGVDSTADAGGPRLVRDSVEWTSDATRVSFRLTAAIQPGSAEGAIQVSSLDAQRGWADHEVQSVQVAASGTLVHVYLDTRPDYETVRLVLRGTGARVLFGVDPAVPFAGVEGGPPATADDGHDAVVTRRLTRRTTRKEQS